MNLDETKVIGGWTGNLIVVAVGESRRAKLYSFQQSAWKIPELKSRYIRGYAYMSRYDIIGMLPDISATQQRPAGLGRLFEDLA